MARNTTIGISWKTGGYRRASSQSQAHRVIPLRVRPFSYPERGHPSSELRSQSHDPCRYRESLAPIGSQFDSHSLLSHLCVIKFVSNRVATKRVNRFVSESHFMNAVRFRQTPSKEALFRSGVTAAACIAAMIAGPFIVSYDNPLTATRVIAAITSFLVAIIRPKASLYLLILGKQIFGLSQSEIDYLGAGHII
jgi:hypothetical protein